MSIGAGPRADQLHGGTAVAPIERLGGFHQCLRKRPSPRPGARSVRARRRRPKPERSCTRRSATSAKASTAHAPRSRQSQLDCPRPDGPACTFRCPEMRKPRPSGVRNQRPRLRNGTPVRRAGARAPRNVRSSMSAGARPPERRCHARQNAPPAPFDKLRAGRGGAGSPPPRPWRGDGATHRRTRTA